MKGWTSRLRRAARRGWRSERRPGTVDAAACEQHDFRLSAWFDGELDERERAVMRKHLERCEPCRERLEGIGAASSWLQVPELAADPYFVTRFRARRDAAALELERARRLVLRLVMPVVAVAVVLALATVWAGERNEASFSDLERQALATGSPAWSAAPDADGLAELVAATLGPREDGQTVRAALPGR